MKEIIFVLVLVLGMLGTGILHGIQTGYWYLLGVFVIFFACFGFMEWLAVKRTGKTISQQVWKWKEKNPISMYIGVGMLLLAWIALMLHFINIL